MRSEHLGSLFGMGFCILLGAIGLLGIGLITVLTIAGGFTFAWLIIGAGIYIFGCYAGWFTAGFTVFV
jgi:hypothetical protein